MMKLLDYYYLVILRGFGDKLEHRGLGLMAGTFSFNIFSLLILFTHNRRVESDYILFTVVGTIILTNIILQEIYNKKRREKIKEKYKDESDDSRTRGVVKVVLYEILSLAFFIFAVWTIGR